jgi:hypothetical protein
MKYRFLTIASLLLLITAAFSLSRDSIATLKTVQLPQPLLKGPMSLEETLATRRSIRSFSPEGLTYEQLSQLA